MMRSVKLRKTFYFNKAKMSKKRFKLLSSPFKLATALSLVALLVSYLAPYIHPATIPSLPFFGLTYPIFLALTLIWLVLWSIFRSKWAIYCLVVLLIGGKLHFRNFSLLSSAPELKQENGLKVLSYNVRLFDLFNPSFNDALASRNQIFDFIRSQEPDVLCLQEFYRQDKPTNFEVMDSLNLIMKTRDYHERSAHKRRTRENYGIAMFSKHPMIARGDVMFEAQGVQDFNYCIFADIVKGLDTFRVYNVHLQSIRLHTDPHIEGEEVKTYGSKKGAIAVYRKLRSAFEKRAEQARRVVEHLKTSPYPVIVCGDFNDTPMSYTYNQFQLALLDAFSGSGKGLGTTYVGRLPAGRIDYLFYSPLLNASLFQIQKQTRSDHRAISCVFHKKTS
jgi:endonuclease/exonuclease/phosphatase family metal-dependent hydrolase